MCYAQNLPGSALPWSNTRTHVWFRENSPGTRFDPIEMPQGTCAADILRAHKPLLVQTPTLGRPPYALLILNIESSSFRRRRRGPSYHRCTPVLNIILRGVSKCYVMCEVGHGIDEPMGISSAVYFHDKACLRRIVAMVKLNLAVSDHL